MYGPSLGKSVEFAWESKGLPVGKVTAGGKLIAGIELAESGVTNVDAVEENVVPLLVVSMDAAMA